MYPVNRQNCSLIKIQNKQIPINNTNDNGMFILLQRSIIPNNPHCQCECVCVCVCSACVCVLCVCVCACACACVCVCVCVCVCCLGTSMWCVLNFAWINLVNADACEFKYPPEFVWRGE